MLLNPIMAMLHNTKDERWHPILFEERPLPGNPENLVRHKSRGHHTTGFPTRDEAMAWARGEADRIEGLRFCLDKDFPWDGEDVPAMVIYFGEENGEIRPILG
jgi:hypothetical protein